MTVKRLLVITCSATKRSDPGLLPALERYDGPVYRVLRAHQRRGHRLPKTLILSAAMGLITPTHPVRDYNQRMTDDLAIVWRQSREGRILLQQSLAGADDHLVVAGKDYLSILEAWTPGVTLMVAPGGIGRKLGQLKRWLET